MLFQKDPRTVWGEGYFTFGSRLCGQAHACLTTPLMRELFTNFCGRASVLEPEKTENFILSVGNLSAELPEDASYVVRVTGQGICLSARDEKSLARAFMTLLDFIEPVCTEPGRECFRIPCFTLQEKSSVAVRMVHLCFLPEFSYTLLRKIVRLCGFMQFTHVIFEGWGMIPFDSFPELAWKKAFTKEQVRLLVREANEMGMEVIPMFNHLGHASQSRSCSGKHAVLDQNPRYLPYFTEDGWVWRIEKEEVRARLREVRRELTELCGEGQYFHIGCDEAYCYGRDTGLAQGLVETVNGIAEELGAEGRRPIMWGDMLLRDRGNFTIRDNHYFCNCHDAEIEKLLLSGISRKVVMADWQYAASVSPFETCERFLQEGFDVLCCPWHTMDSGNIAAAAETARALSLHGFMLTTWHTTLCHEIIKAGLWVRGLSVPDTGDENLLAGGVIRKLYFADGRYEDCGWKNEQVIPQFT